MIAWWAFALALVAGCNQILGLDAPAGGGGDGDARDHDAHIIDGPADRDGDGVNDPDDLCPDAFDPGQEDEDGDRRGDRCDLCPHLAQQDDVDGEEDGIPDACDPFPAIAGGRLRWNGFHRGDELDDWGVTGAGGAEWASGEVRIAPVLDGEVRLLRREDDGNDRKRTRVIAALTFEPPSAGGAARRAVGLVTDVGGISNADYFLCQIETDLPVTQVRLADYRIQGAVASAIASLNVGSTYPAAEVEMEFELGGVDELNAPRTAACRASAVEGSAQLPATEVIDLPPGRTGVRSVGVPVRVRWIVIIDHP
jgi:hypothetical protein